ncbi:MAG: alpha-L-arabinofuranosidase [Verrucomicrobia bacterium]|nr:MAG: alpha-L-arabinofuranosidase [Verrucomicrobiota bacterium]
MLKHFIRLLPLLLASFAQHGFAAARITVNAAEPGHAIPPTLWGVFFEDINHSADGGIYPELVRNRSFEDSDKLDGWRFTSLDGKSAAMVVVADGTSVLLKPLNSVNRRSLRIVADGEFALQNEGYWGMNVAQGEHYTLKFAIRVLDGFDAPIVAKLVSADGSRLLGSAELKGFSREWSYRSAELTAVGSDTRAKLVLSSRGKGTLFLDMVSLMPKKNWKHHGLRPDLAQAIHGLEPGFMRFPGGCWVEGETIDRMYNWKKTVGDIDSRIPLWNIWGYYATHGLGFHEYLQLAEDLGAEPLFDTNCGMSHKEVVPMGSMDKWVQDALDAIEYANGPTNSHWGAMRAKAGHPAPFKLKYMEIGNENGGEAYLQRWQLFAAAIRSKYPYIQLIANFWKNGYPQLPRPDVVDEHYYDTPEWFMAHANRYDKYDRKGPKIFVGEYAVTRNCGLGNLRGAIGEAAFMTGLERNSDVVCMASYAPLLVNLKHRAWNPDLINFDTANWYGLPSYYVQKLFAQNRGDVVLPTKVESGEPIPRAISGRIGVGTWNTQAEFSDIKVTSAEGKVLFASDFGTTNGWKFLGSGNWALTNGALRQTAEKEFVRAIAGDSHWTDYTLELRARKLGGREGFLILFGIQNDEDRNWWNIGGWDNTAHAIEFGEQRGRRASHVESIRWYDIRVQVHGAAVKCWLDGKLIHDVKDVVETTDRVYVTSALDRSNGDIIVKEVNTAPEPTDVELTVNGLKPANGKVKATVLSSGSARDENSIELPQHVAPKGAYFSAVGNVVRHTLPPNSLAVLRISP